MSSADTKDDEAQTRQKELAFYSASVAAWYTTALEHDKTLLALSGGGIGLLLTLLTVGGGRVTACAVTLYLLATFSFTVCLVAVLIVLNRNKRYIESIVDGRSRHLDPVLVILDTLAMYAFGIGALLTAAIVLFMAVHLLQNQDLAMSQKQAATPTAVNESVSHLTKDQGSADFGKSFNGAGNLAPKQTIPNPTTVTTPVPATTPAPAGSDAPAKQGKESGKK